MAADRVVVGGHRHGGDGSCGPERPLWAGAALWARRPYEGPNVKGGTEREGLVRLRRHAEYLRLTSSPTQTFVTLSGAPRASVSDSKRHFQSDVAANLDVRVTCITGLLADVG